MISQLQRVEFTQLFPFIHEADATFVDEFFSKAQYIELSEATSICEQGQNCSHLALLMGGIGRVYKLSPSGREVTLYRIQQGESCVLTASCIMNHDEFPAMAVSETEIRGLLISPADVRDWFCRDVAWQRFIFGLLSHRLGDIISVVEEVAFKRIDVRLAQLFVKTLDQGQTMVKKTHAELAADLGSSREVISRILRDFTHREIISSGRGSIELINAEVINELAKEK